MSYSRGFLTERVTIQRNARDNTGSFGRGSAGVKWEDVKTIWANVSWTKGTAAMREGAMDAYDVVMIRCDYQPTLDRHCRLRHRGKMYAINSLNQDARKNEATITATEIVNP